jgi:hypothetical protein
MSTKPRYRTYAEFFPYYLSEHIKPATRFMHYVGTSLVIVLIGMAIVFKNAHILWILPVAGYSWAWAGHAIFEKNKPATFAYPLWSLMGDFHMYWLALTGKIKAHILALPDTLKPPT